MKQMKLIRVLTIAGSDSCGGAGIQADLKTITALGGFGMSVITAVTAQNTSGVQGICRVPPAFVKKQFESVVTDIGVDAVKTGMLGSAEILKAVAGVLRRYNIKKIVVDPVMAAKGGKALIRGRAREALIAELIPLAFVVTPNVPEAELLSGIRINSQSGMKEAAQVIHGLGAKNVVIKGGHLPGDAIDILYDGIRFHKFSSVRINKKDVHGTGCIFSSAIATLLARGKSVPAAVKGAKDYVTRAIRTSQRAGSGYRLATLLLPRLSVK